MSFSERAFGDGQIFLSRGGGESDNRSDILFGQGRKVREDLRDRRAFNKARQHSPQRDVNLQSIDTS